MVHRRAVPQHQPRRAQHRRRRPARRRRADRKLGGARPAIRDRLPALAGDRLCGAPRRARRRDPTRSSAAIRGCRSRPRRCGPSCGRAAAIGCSRRSSRSERASASATAADRGCADRLDPGVSFASKPNRRAASTMSVQKFRVAGLRVRVARCGPAPARDQKARRLRLADLPARPVPPRTRRPHREPTTRARRAPARCARSSRSVRRRWQRPRPDRSARARRDRRCLRWPWRSPTPAAAVLFRARFGVPSFRARPLRAAATSGSPRHCRRSSARTGCRGRRAG